MIWESSFWKDDLLKIEKRLTNRISQKRWPERSIVSLEKDVFISFYSIRKLIEARKLSDNLVNLLVPVTCYSSTGKPVTLLNWHKLDELYDFSGGKLESLELSFLCNQIVHSYVFSPSFNDDGRLAGFLFCSDWQRNKNLYGISVAEVVKVLNQVGADYPNESHWQYDSGKQDYLVSNK